MSSAFSRALPQTRLATHNPRIVQTFTAPAAHLVEGDFGFKVPISGAVSAARSHKNGRVKYIQVKKTLAKGGSVDWVQREKEVLLLRKWKETNVRVTNANESANESFRFSLTNSGHPRDRGVRKIPIFSRFDRGSRKNGLPLEPAERELASLQEQQDEGNVDALVARYSGLAVGGDVKAQDPITSLPNYILYGEEEFEKILEIVRAHRSEFRETRLRQMAELRRLKKLEVARQAWEEDYRNQLWSSSRVEGSEPSPLPKEPTLSDFPMEAELEWLRSGLQTKDVEDDDLPNPNDLFNLARSTNNHYVADFVKGLFRKYVTDDPKSTSLPSWVNRSSRGNVVTRLHPLSGLQYSQPEPMFTNLIAPALPGKVLQRDEPRSSTASPVAESGQHDIRRGRDWLVAIGGQIHRAPSTVSRNLKGINWLQEPDKKDAGMYQFKLADVTLQLSNPADKPDRQFGGSRAHWSRDLRKPTFGYIRAHAVAQYPGSTAGSAVGAPAMNMSGSEGPNTMVIPGSPAWASSEAVERVARSPFNPGGSMFEGLWSDPAKAGFNRPGPQMNPSFGGQRVGGAAGTYAWESDPSTTNTPEKQGEKGRSSGSSGSGFTSGLSSQSDFIARLNQVYGDAQPTSTTTDGAVAEDAFAQNKEGDK